MKKWTTKDKTPVDHYVASSVRKTFDWFDLFWFLCFNAISTFLGYLMPKPSFEKNSSGTI